MSETMDVYLKEYSSDDAIKKYSSNTAGYGISYLLENDYADVYVTALNRFLKTKPDTPLRVLEIGCSAGMNVISLLGLLERKGRKGELAVGTDFSERLIEAANAEAKNSLSKDQQKKIRFAVARNETLATDLAKGMHVSREKLAGSFHIIVGVNTFR